MAQEADDLLEAGAVRRAWDRVRGHVHRTPSMSATLLGRRVGEVDLHVKAENLQKTGSFKPRGVLSKLLGMSAEDRERGVVTVSAGNHAQALAWGSRSVDVDCTVVMPETAPATKVDACRGYGAHVVLHGDVFDAFERALALRDEEGLTFVHPFDDDEIVAGQGTVGLELLDDLPEVQAVVVPVGGGGLLAGIAVAVKRRAPSVRVYGVEPEGADSMCRSLEEGEPVRLEEVDTIADGLGSPMAGELTLPLVRRCVDGMVRVPDDAIATAVGQILTFTKLLVEPAGAAGVAALAEGLLPLSPGERVAAVLSGGNVDLERLEELL